MNSALRLRSIPVRVMRRRYGAVTTSMSRHFEPSSLGGVSVVNKQRPNSSRLQTPSRRSLHSTVILYKDYPEHIIFSMPALSPTMEMGTISKWELKEGDSFTAGAAICAVETDKATMDFEAQDDGFIAKILREGSSAVDIAIGTPICVVVEDEGDVAAFADFMLEEEAPVAAATSEPATAAAAAVAPAPGRQVSDEYVLLPSARFLAESKGLDATGLAGTAKGGRVTKGDVLQAIKNGTPMPALATKTAAAAPPPAPAAVAALSAAATSTPTVDLAPLEIESFGTFEDVPNSSMRKIIARRLTESKRDVPHFYTAVEVELDNLMKLRKELVSKHDIKISVNDFIIRCAALALRDVPEANGTYDPKTDSVKLHDSIDVSIAVAIPAGLITPIVPNTDKLGLSEITNKVRDLAGRAREGKLQPEEYQGGTFCISNLGMFGIDEFSAVINPPQAAILAVGGGTRRIVPTPYVQGAEKQAKPSIKTIMTAKLSADRRVIDEATASLFLSAFNHYITKPELLLL